MEWSISHMAKVDVGDQAKDKAAAAEEAQFKESGFDLSAATHWPGVAEKDVLVAPYEARLAWREFMSASGLSVQQVWICITNCTLTFLNNGRVRLLLGMAISVSGNGSSLLRVAVGLNTLTLQVALFCCHSPQTGHGTSFR